MKNPLQAEEDKRRSSKMESHSDINYKLDGYLELKQMWLQRKKWFYSYRYRFDMKKKITLHHSKSTHFKAIIKNNDENAQFYSHNQP